ncbi:hypothetical protein PACTADRAFT_230 [Pachysolen tannophilus NRRL Y-2460]|uniref:Early meiotic induction protein 1 n=1 Tax=Pachysolen tannophilus NRRL Y-2460 TaxID=669874 RepID=A0A1E4U159_PACTA|nr:hypothetical protein PACTADRAFT_230 [Pachysolen tannophilus NRRL Y-2460]
MFGLGDKSSASQQQNGIDDDGGLKDVIDIFQDAAKDDEAEKIRLLKRDRKSKQIEDSSLDKFPKEMSCLTAMDELLQCFSAGGQLRNYYRYGDFSLCERHYDKLKFCMKVNLLPSESEKEYKIANYYKERLIKDSKKGSSEDIWDARE